MINPKYKSRIDHRLFRKTDNKDMDDSVSVHLFYLHLGDSRYPTVELHDIPEMD
jgi:hypothetical protein